MELTATFLLLMHADMVQVFISDDDSQAGRKPMIVVDPSHKPSEFGRQFVMFSNVLFSSATIAMLRTLANRNKNNTPPVNAENLPKWYLVSSVHVINTPHSV